MMRQPRRFISMLMLACSLGTGAAEAQGFSGAGSTFAQPILARWGQIFATLQGEGGAYVSADNTLDYEPVGSMGGVMRVLQGGVDFGATDIPMLPEELAKHGLAQFPMVTGGVAIVVNLSEIATGTLRLSGPTLAAIYLGEITRWSDPAISAINPGLTLPDVAINVLHRSDGSGTTYHFTTYLAGANAAWRDRIGVDPIIKWPLGSGVKGNAELAVRVRQTSNSIAYVEASQASRLGLAVALVQNSAGRFVAPTLANLQAASSTVVWEPRRDFHQTLAVASGEEAYPITATVFALVPRRPRSAARGRLVLEFFRFALTERAADAVTLGYVSLPDSVVRQVADYWRTTVRGAP